MSGYFISIIRLVWPSPNNTNGIGSTSIAFLKTDDEVTNVKNLYSNFSINDNRIALIKLFQKYRQYEIILDMSTEVYAEKQLFQTFCCFLECISVITSKYSDSIEVFLFADVTSHVLYLLINRRASTQYCNNKDSKSNNLALIKVIQNSIASNFNKLPTNGLEYEICCLLNGINSLSTSNDGLGKSILNAASGITKSLMQGDINNLIQSIGEGINIGASIYTKLNGEKLFDILSKIREFKYSIIHELMKQNDIKTMLIQFQQIVCRFNNWEIAVAWISCLYNLISSYPLVVSENDFVDKCKAVDEKLTLSHLIEAAMVIKVNKEDPNVNAYMINSAYKFTENLPDANPLSNKAIRESLQLKFDDIRKTKQDAIKEFQTLIYFGNEDFYGLQHYLTAGIESHTNVVSVLKTFASTVVENSNPQDLLSTVFDVIDKNVKGNSLLT